MLTQQEMLYGLALPFGVALVLMLIFGVRRTGVAFALGAAYIAGHIGLTGRPAWPIPSPEHWVPVLALTGAAVGMLVSWRYSSEGAVWLGRVVLVLAALNTVLMAQVKQGWSGAEAFVWVQAILGIWLVVWWSVDELAERAQGATVPAVMALSVAASAFLVLLDGSPALGQYALVLAAALVAAMIVSWVRRDVTLATGGLAVVFVIWGSLLLCEAFYADGTALWSVLVIALSPLLGWVRTTQAVQSMSRGMAMAATLLIVLVPLIAALTPVLIKAMK